MAQYNVQGPDGTAHVIEGPDGASDQEIIGQAQKLFPAAQTSQETPKFYELEKQPGLPVSQTPTDASTLDRIKGAAMPLIKQAGRQMFEGLASPMPGSILTTPARVMQENASQLGADVARGTQDSIGTVPARAAGLAASVAADPTSYLGADQIFGKNFIPMPDSPSLIKKLVGLFQKGTSPEEIKSGTQAVTDMVSGAKKTFGDALNEAKSKILPASIEDKAESIRKYGNVFDFDPKSPLELPAELKPVQTGAKATLKSPAEGLPDLEIKAKGPMMNDAPEDLAKMGLKPDEIKSAKQPIYDINTALPALNGEGPHPAGSTLGQDTLEKYGYKLPGSDMPYKMGEIKTPENLVTEIERFKKNVPYISPEDRVKAASYLQDQMTQQGVDFNKSQASTLGLLKSQYKDLSGIIHDADPALAAAKGKMSEVYDAVGNLQKNMQEPGQAEAYLRRIAANPTGKNADALAHLKAVESLTGKETVDDLFTKFKKDAGSFTYEELKHPLANIIRKELPKVGQATAAGLQRLAAPAITAGKLIKFQPFNTPEMQSLKDRLKNRLPSAE